MELKRRNKTLVDAGMSSMTDLVFLLLIFFVIVSLSNPAIPVDLPTGDTISVDKPTTVNVGVTPENMYYLNDDVTKFYTFEELKPILEGKMADVPSKNIKISGDKTADYEYVFNLIALSKQKGWTPVLVFKN